MLGPLEQASRKAAERKGLGERLTTGTRDTAALDNESIVHDRLRLIFTCCHPALQPEARVALTLLEACDLTTEESAHAFLTVPSTLAQRTVRAKAKTREARIPYQVLSLAELRIGLRPRSK